MFKLYSLVEAQPNQIIKWALLTRFRFFFFKSFSLMCATTTTAARDDDVTNSLRKREEEVEKIRILNLKRDPLIRQMNMNILKAKAIAWDFFFSWDSSSRVVSESRLLLFPSFSLNSLLLVGWWWWFWCVRDSRDSIDLLCNSNRSHSQSRLKQNVKRKEKKEKKNFRRLEF